MLQIVYDVVVYATVPPFMYGLIALIRKLYPKYAVDAELRRLHRARRQRNRRIRRI